MEVRGNHVSHGQEFLIKASSAPSLNSLLPLVETITVDHNILALYAFNLSAITSIISVGDHADFYSIGKISVKMQSNCWATNSGVASRTP